MGRPQPSHPFAKLHPTVYKIARVARRNLPTDDILVDENQCLQDERVGCSSHCMRPFMWDFEGSHGVP